MVQPLRTDRPSSGAALIMALGLLFLFVALGTAFLGYMVAEGDRARVDMQDLRAQTLAEAGVQAAVGEIQAALRAGRVPEEEYAFGFPVYVSEQDALVKHDGIQASVSVTVSDESAKINVNHAPRAVLESVLGVNRAQARAILQNLPTAPAPADQESGRWLTSVDALVTRGFVSPEAFERIDKDLLTVYTVADARNPKGYINLNSAPPQVLAAALNVPLATAEKAAAQRPFASIADVIAATGQNPMNFNIPPAPEAPDDLPKELAFASRCFRIASRATVGELGPNEQVHRPAHRYAEAVVVFDKDERPLFQYWSETAPGDAGEPEQGARPIETAAAVSDASP